MNISKLKEVLVNAKFFSLEKGQIFENHLKNIQEALKKMDTNKFTYIDISDIHAVMVMISEHLEISKTESVITAAALKNIEKNHAIFLARGMAGRFEYVRSPA